ncbi:hypothetical protein ABFA07_012435 [Porites harrisoni]
MPAYNWIIVVSVLISDVNSFTVIRSTDPLGRGGVDKFSNTDCVPALCGSLRSATCWTTDCCFCQCNYATPNYVMSEGVCRTNDEVDTGCQIENTLSEDFPLPVKEVTKPGNLQFINPGCNGIVQNSGWYYRLSSIEWIAGPRNIFIIRAVPNDGSSLNLQWDKGLDAKYTGLVLKFVFTCQNTRTTGCVLMKSKGNYTTANEVLSSSLVPLGSNDGGIGVTGGETSPTLPSGNSGGKGNNGDLDPAANTKQKVEARQTGVVVAGVTVSLAFGIVLVFVTLLLMVKKRRNEETEKDQRRNAPNATYEEPSRPPPRLGVNTESFHNEFYSSDCVLSISKENINATDTLAAKTLKMGPLPPLPTAEGIYEEPVLVRTIAYHPLAKDSQQTDRAYSNVLSNEQNPPPDYNVLEPPSTDDDDYDDNIAECHGGELSTKQI